MLYYARQSRTTALIRLIIQYLPYSAEVLTYRKAVGRESMDARLQMRDEGLVVIFERGAWGCWGRIDLRGGPT